MHLPSFSHFSSKMSYFAILCLIFALQLAYSREIETGADSEERPPSESIGFQRVPPAVMKCKHNVTVKRVFMNSDLVVYYDAETPAACTWPVRFLTRYTELLKREFDYRIPQRFEAILHHCNGAEETGSIYDSQGFDAIGEFAQPNMYNLANIMRGPNRYLVENMRQYKGNPLVKDYADWLEYGLQYSFAETFGYKNITEDYVFKYVKTPFAFSPDIDIYPFKDFYIPLMQKFGGLRIFGRLFDAVYKHWPREGNEYKRQMKIGEFVHFFSGALNSDIMDIAKKTFIWLDIFEQQYQGARREFPQLLTY